MNLLVTQLQHQDPRSPRRTASSSRSWRSSARSSSSSRPHTTTLDTNPRTFFSQEGTVVMSWVFSASLSGLNANQQKLSVIGNNLANINTVGFKASTVDFRRPGQPVGRRRQREPDAGRPRRDDRRRSRRTSAQGGIENTGVPTNVAIQGSGFFVVGDANHRAYTRAGDFPLRRRRHARDAGRRSRAGLHRRRSGHRRRRSPPASRRTSSSRRACCVRRRRPRSSAPQQPERSTRRRRHVHGVGPDLRLARHAARGDDDLQEHRPGRVDLLAGGARSGCERRRRRHADCAQTGTLSSTRPGS